MNNEITPERLTGLAEAQDIATYCGTSIFNRKTTYFIKVEDDDNDYQPHKDWRQGGPVGEWLIDEVGIVEFTRLVALFDYKSDLALAIVLAALAYVEGKDVS